MWKNSFATELRSIEKEKIKVMIFGGITTTTLRSSKPEDFLRAGTELPRKLRDTLRSRGVYIPKDKKSIAGNLIALINFDEPPEWPNSDKDYKQISRLLKKDPVYSGSDTTKEPRTGSTLEIKRKQKQYTNYSQDNYQRTTPAGPERQNPSILDYEQDDNDFRIANYRPHGFSKQILT